MKNQELKTIKKGTNILNPFTTDKGIFLKTYLQDGRKMIKFFISTSGNGWVTSRLYKNVFLERWEIVKENNKISADKYRFDDAYECVYKYVESGYLYECGYFQSGIKSSMSEKEKIKIMKKRELMSFGCV